MQPRWLRWVAGLALVVVSVAALRHFVRHMAVSKPEGERKIAMIHILGTMTSSKKTVALLERYRNDEDIKAIVLRIDTPGGGVGVAQEIVREMERAKAQKKYLVASLGSVAASGGYYVASAADCIVANPGTMTGSIGVIIPLTNAEELMKKVGLRFESVKSGQHKDIGSFTRKLTKEEERLLQDMVDDVYAQFIDAIMKGRAATLKSVYAKQRQLKESEVTDKMVRDAVMEVADGRIFSGAKAMDYGLVDRLGNITDAVEVAAAQAKIDGVPVIVEEKKKFSILEYLLGESAEAITHVIASELLPVRYQLKF